MRHRGYPVLEITENLTALYVLHRHVFLPRFVSFPCLFKFSELQIDLPVPLVSHCIGTPYVEQGCVL
jgi:hypothetical protein